MVLKEVWITAAEDDFAARNAIALAKSLRRSLTRRKVVVIPGLSVSTGMMKLLQDEFDGSLPLDMRTVVGEPNLGCLEFEEMVKICLHGIRFFQRGIFISSSVLVLSNIDFMFESLFESSDNEMPLEGELETTGVVLNNSSPLIAIVPSLVTFAFMKQHFVSSKSASIPDVPVLKALQAKSAKIFSKFGVSLSSNGAINLKLDEGVRIVKLPFKYSSLDLSFECLQKWGRVGQMLQELLPVIGMDVHPGVDQCHQKVRTIPLERMEEEPIAIIGMACRLPASNDVEEFWTLLMNKGDAIITVPEWRWPDDQVKEVTPEERLLKGGFLKCPVDEFDAKFFGMSPMEMEFTDPQQRMLLEVSWEALEDAAIDAHSLKGTQTGIFTGTWTRHYADLMNKVGFKETEFFRSYMGNAYGATAGRMAHFYGVTGSNIATESGCSSSMVAVGLACRSLRKKQTTLALACGVNLILQPYTKDFMAAFCSQDGRCKTFDVAADGYGRAEGCGVLVLKRLSDAVRDGDSIRAVIRGYADSQEGISRSLGTPTVDVESLAMSLALKDAEVEPREVSFVEAHGTGTAVGDPMEMEAIAKVYSPGRETPLVVTSVKTNVGHTESCSGITGIIKTVLSLEREVIPPHRALDTLNPKIDLSKTPAIIPLEATPWRKKPNRRRIAGVSSFGITGTDAHLILEESPVVPSSLKASVSSSSPPFQVLALSARSKVALTDLIGKYKDTLQKKTLVWKDVTFTANTGRAHFAEFRTAVVASDTSDFLRQVERQAVLPQQCPPVFQRPKVVFMFTGQGSQYAGMAKDLYETSADFRQTFNKCDEIVKKKYSIDIKRALWDPVDVELINQTLYSPACIFVVGFCLAELWKKWGFTPDVVVGHSLGEYAAACVAGIISLDDALKLVAERSRMVDSLPRGKMIVIQADVKEAQRLLKTAGSDVALDVAAINSPEQTALAGTEESVLKFKALCTKNGVRSHVLNATHAFHSFMMEPALPTLRKVAESVKYNRPTCTFVSGMAGSEVSSVDAEYWVKNARQPVNFVGACKALQRLSEGLVCVEIGAQPILSSFVAANLERNKGSLTLLPSLRRSQNDWRTLMDSLAKLYTTGFDGTWSNIYRHVEAVKVPGLPTYPFQRKKFWFEKPKKDRLLFSGRQLHPLVNFLLPNASPTKIFQTGLSLENETYVKDHVVGRHIIFPAAGYVEMVLAAGHCATLAEFEDFRLPRQPIVIRDLTVEAPLGLLEKEASVHLQTILEPPGLNTSPSDSLWTSVTINRRQEDSASTKSWVRHVSAKFSSVTNDIPIFETLETLEVDRLKESLPTADVNEFYENVKSVGLNFGESFCSLKRLWKGETETLAEVASPPGVSFFCHPVAIDAVIQTLMASKDEKLQGLLVPVKINQLVWFSSASDSVKFYVYVDRRTEAGVLYDESGRRLVAMSGVSFVPTSVAGVENALQAQKLVLPQLLEEEWVPVNVSADNPTSLGEALPISQKLDTWMLLGESQDNLISTGVAKALRSTGRRVVLMNEDIVTWKSTLESGRVEGVVFFSLEKTSELTKPAQKLLHILQTLISTNYSANPKVVVVTFGTIVLGDQSFAAPYGGILWGMSKTFRSENPTFPCVNVDLDPHDTPEGNIPSLLRVVWEVKDDLVAVRDRKLFTVKLKRLKLKSSGLPLPQNVSRFSLVFPKSKAISDLEFGAMKLQEVRGSEVEVNVRTAALNFKDVLCVLKPTEEFEKNAAVGADMAGVISAVGPDVKRWKVGDVVFGAFFNFGGLPSHIVAEEDLFVKLPQHLSFADGSTLPIVFMTAYHCLVDVAKLQKGETVLIHTASGGVGIAAIQVARNIGAKIIATAGSRRKRAFLREVMGISDVFHSRDLSYAEGVRSVTGTGVDVVLNSLTGPGFKEASLDVCNLNGRFIEMSKLKIWSVDEVRAIRPDVNYQIVDLTNVSSDTWKNLLVQMDDFLNRGKLRPLPYLSFESVDIRAALTRQQKARHIGKIVCRMPSESSCNASTCERCFKLFNDRSSYLITGGLGGIGLETAKWMASEGAKFIVLCGRRPPSDKAAAVISDLNAMGKAVLAVQGDIGKWDDCKRLVEDINSGRLSVNGEKLPPLRGIQHAAGCLSDGMLSNQTWAKYEDTFNGKVKGAWHLHKLTMNTEFPLEHFVMYSSISATFGGMGQSNYAAANTFLDSLTHFRNALGLPATSVNWGQWGQVGLAVDMELNFCTPFTPLQAFASLKEILKSHKSQVGVVETDFLKLRHTFPWMSRGYGVDIIDASSSVSIEKEGSATQTSDKFWEEVELAKGDPKETEGVVQRLLFHVIPHILKMDEKDDLDVHQSLQDMGLDSLMTVELKNYLQGALGPKVSLSSSTLSDAQSIHDLTIKLRDLILSRDKPNKTD